ncbi:RDD family protein [Glaciihabitans tibetensis]|uniref:RDD family protein n=1 Tax=Glaciihabitans tibetensis TaxID=1266600 RepID=A0A2T0VJC1_9MICO|nr:RDD family protein [Glaciihabitans tibetensis]PRY70307.1 RDD family protein [Glaciihabitans tibetensis]
MPDAAASPVQWPGQRLGLPRAGSGSIARAGRRIAAIAIDWALSVLVSSAFFAYDPIATLLVFVSIQIIFVAFTGASIGHRLLGLRVAVLGGAALGFWRPIVRALLIALLIPAVIWDLDQRGMHDRLVGTVLLRR